MKDVSVLIPTWLTAGHALGAYKSVRKYYPDVPVYFVSDYPTEEGKNDWHQLHPRGPDSYDIEYDKVQKLDNAAFMWRTHKGWETNGHGNAVTHAMKFIHTKWVVHLSDDARIIKEGAIEYLIEQTDKKTVGVGDDFSRDWGPNISKIFCIFRGDIYHKYDMDFHGDLDKCLDAGAPFLQAMIKKGYNLQYVNINPYVVHLTSGKSELWDKYF